jgi:DegV family protein with EDD domain
MKLGLVTDSTADLPRYAIEEHGIQVVPCVLVLAGQTYSEDQGLPREEFYKQLPHLKPAPTTSIPSIAAFETCYRGLLAQGCDRILSIHAAGALTGLVSTAGQAARAFDGRVTIVDSLSLSMGLGFQVLAAAEVASEGMDSALAAIASTRSRLQLFAALDTLEYARRSGRLPGALALLGGMLRIKPVVELIGGELKSVGTVRTTQQANDHMAALLRAGGRLERLAILHAGAESRARAFLHELMQDSSQALPRDIWMVNVTTVIGVHVGPNALGFAAVRASSPT